MYLHLGQDTVVRDCDIIGIFDLDITTQSIRTRNYLNTAEKRGEVRYVTEDLPKVLRCGRSAFGSAGLYLPALHRHPAQTQSERHCGVRELV